MSARPSREELSALARRAKATAQVLAAIARQPHRADEAMSAACSGLADALRSFDPARGVKLSTFAAIRVAGEVLDALAAGKRRDAREVALSELEAAEEGEAAEQAVRAYALCCAAVALHEGAESGLLRRERHARLHEALEGLPPERRKLLDLRYWEEVGPEEIAALLGLPERTERDRRAKALVQVRKALVAKEREEDEGPKGQVVPLRRRGPGRAG